jgi:hypothetical protein
VQIWRESGDAIQADRGRDNVGKKRRSRVRVREGKTRLLIVMVGLTYRRRKKASTDKDTTAPLRGQRSRSSTTYFIQVLPSPHCAIQFH